MGVRERLQPLLQKCYCTVHVPRVCHPLLALPLLANIYTFLAPAYPPLNVIARFTVRCVVDIAVELLPRFTLHWLLLNVPALPTAPPLPHAFPASFSRYSVFVARA